MAIPFKSPISFGYTTLSEDSGEFKIKAVKNNALTLGPDTAGIETYDGNSIWLSPNGVRLKSLNRSNISINKESINLTSDNLSVYDLDSNNLLLNCNTTLNTFGNNNYSTMIKGKNLYLYRDNEPIIEANDGLILLGDSVNHENYDIQLYGKSLTIDSPNIKLNQGANTNIDLNGRTLTINGTVRMSGSTQLSNNSILSTWENRTSSLNLACLKDFNDTVMIRGSYNYIWNSTKPVIFIIPNVNSQTTLYFNDTQDDIDMYTSITDNENPDYTIGIWAFRNSNNIIVLNIGKESITFKQFKNKYNYTVGWKSNLGFQYFINDTFPGVTS